MNFVVKVVRTFIQQPHLPVKVRTPFVFAKPSSERYVVYGRPQTNKQKEIKKSR